MSSSRMFWGLIVESGQSYTQHVGRSFSIRMAVLEEPEEKSVEQNDSRVKVFVKYENTEYLLCILSSNNYQVPLNVKFETGSPLTLRAVGGKSESRIHLTGYCLEEPSSLDSSVCSNSTIMVPFEGLQQSILVLSDRRKEQNGGEKKAKKRVSIDDDKDDVDDITIRNTINNSKKNRLDDCQEEDSNNNGYLNLFSDEETTESDDSDTLFDIPCSQKGLKHELWESESQENSEKTESQIEATVVEHKTEDDD